MKNKRIKSFVLAALMICSMLVMSACGPSADKTSEPDTAKYKVTVIDTDGTPCKSGVVVKFMKDGKQVAMQAVDAGGTAVKELDKGDYTIELMFSDSTVAYHYNEAEMTLSSTKTELQIDLCYAVNNEGMSILGGDGNNHQAYYVSPGKTYVELKESGINYFLFVPPVAGLYEFSIDGEVETLGYYGSSYFVSNMNIADMTGENVFRINSYEDQSGEIGTVPDLVIGITGKPGAKDAMLSITRIGAPEIDIAHQPWTVYKTTTALKPFVMPAGAVVNDFDLNAATDTYKLVYNESDGYYHMNSEDGPLVLVRVGKNADREDLYLPSFETILENSPISSYHYDENGNFVEKVTYNESLQDHIKNMDQDSGLHPLTKDLKYIIEQRGEYVGWWDPSSINYLFCDADGKPMDVNTDIAWLFACCYISE